MRRGPGTACSGCTRRTSSVVRILLDSVIAPGDPRGVGRYVRGLAGALASIPDTTVVVAHGRWHSDFFEPLARAGIDVVPIDLPSPARSARHAWQALRASALARRVSADVVHVAGCVPASLASGPPTVVTIHDLAEYDRPEIFGPVQLWYRRLVLRHQLRGADRLIAPSAFTAARLGRIDPLAARRTTVVHHGPGIDPSTQVARPGTRIEGPFFLCVGAVQRYKNLPRVIRAYRRLASPVASLVIAGIDHDDRRAVQLAMAGDLRILRLPAVTDAEIAWLYRHAVALIFPSLYEGFGLPIIEAMAFGCPVITSDHGAMHEVAGDAALVVDPLDEAAIRTAMQQLLEDGSVRVRLSTAGRERAEGYTWDRAAAGTMAVYRAALGTSAAETPSFDMWQRPSDV
jgi:glycosyltransferase involved in cell wall biosynthesis